MRTPRTWLSVLSCIIPALLSFDILTVLAGQAPKKGSQLTSDQRAAVEKLLRDADELDEISRRGTLSRADLTRYDTVIKGMAGAYVQLSPVLPKTDIRLLLCNMMDGYAQLGKGLFGIPKPVSRDELDARALAAGMRKVLLRKVVQGQLSTAERQLVEMLRKQGQEGC
jgi:hypothetical protein